MKALILTERIVVLFRKCLLNIAVLLTSATYGTIVKLFVNLVKAQETKRTVYISLNYAELLLKLFFPAIAYLSDSRL